MQRKISIKSTQLQAVHRDEIKHHTMLLAETLEGDETFNKHCKASQKLKLMQKHARVDISKYQKSYKLFILRAYQPKKRTY